MMRSVADCVIHSALSSVNVFDTSHVQQSSIDVDVDVVDLRAQADASMPASNNNVIIIQYI